ncbi:MAG TPA: hypothetical protein VG347_11595 [Verrucomicrobiae bacterium]|nr:hypothetical protein [Verrucomicrobiae bacterium]
MKYFFLLAIICIHFSPIHALGRNMLPELESRISLGANLTNALFIIDDGPVYIETETNRYLDPAIIEQAKQMPECWPAKNFPEGNWGEPVKGIHVSLRFDKQVYTNGENIKATVLVRNETNHVFGFYYANKVAWGVANYRMYTVSNQPVAAKPDYTGVRVLSSSMLFLDSGFQRKYVDRLGDTFNLMNGRYLVQASIQSIRMNATNGVDPYEITSAKVPIEIR